MALIRIVDAWLRSPASPPTHQRAVMVVAEAWAEQRVLMRAYANSPDQTRPTIVLHGQQLAIGPAGTDPHGPWGIHVEPPVDGRAQMLRDELRTAARRLSGSKGNPARLMDEAPAFDNKRTNHWSPGTPRDLLPGSGQPQPYYEPGQPQPQPPARAPEAGHGGGLPHGAKALPDSQQFPQPPQKAGASYSPVTPNPAYYQPHGIPEPAAVSPPGVAQHMPARWAESPHSQPHPQGHYPQGHHPQGQGYQPQYAQGQQGQGYRPVPGQGYQAPQAPQAHQAHQASQAPQAQGRGHAQGHGPGQGARGWHSPVAPTPPLRDTGSMPAAAPGTRRRPATTAHGFAEGPGAPEPPVPAPPPAPFASEDKPSFVSVVRRTLPIGFQLSDLERTVLRALGENAWLSARQVAQISGSTDGVAWMEAFIAKLASVGLDLVARGDDKNGEPSYVLRH